MKLTKTLLALIPVFALTACASTQEWNAAGGDREQGIVKVSYQYSEYQRPSLSEQQAGNIAENRCNLWGYAHADFIPGQLRECSVTDGGNCTLWKVTREYQCTAGDAKMAGRGAEGVIAPLRLAR
jgi:hypothetical protein